MKPSEVIKLDCQQNGADPRIVLAEVQKIIKQGGFILSQGNTVLAMKKLQPSVFEAHIFTHDSPLALAQAVKTFFYQMQGKGVHRVYGQKPRNLELVELLKMLGKRDGVEVVNSDIPKYYWMADI